MNQLSKISLLLLLLPLPYATIHSQTYSRLELQMRNMGLTDIGTADGSIYIDLKYATTDNFTGIVLYDTLRTAYLHSIAAEKLLKAQKLLKALRPDLTLLIYDAARPLSVQKKMYDAVRGTNKASYVANPSKTGLHNYGIAVDLTVCNLQGEALDMGTSFDFLGKRASIRNEESFLSKTQIANRKLLRRVMTEAGFRTVSGEWWHFNALTLEEAKKRCRLIE